MLSRVIVVNAHVSNTNESSKTCIEFQFKRQNLKRTSYNLIHHNVILFLFVTDKCILCAAH